MSTKLLLSEPTIQDKRAVWGYRQEFIDSKDNPAGTSRLLESDSYKSWLDSVARGKDSTMLEADRVPATLYLAYDTDQNLVGMIQLRHKLNEYLSSLGGHIGYSVRRSQRRKGYGTKMLGLALIEARKLGIENVLVTCDDDNVGSAAVIEANGGRLENSVIFENNVARRRYWIDSSKTA